MFSYTANFIPTNVFVIGAGGTGSRLMPMLSQFLRSVTRGQSNMGWIEDPTIWLIDDDTVELKNLLRQNFIHDDVGKYKAAVVAERYSRAYGVNIVPYTERITTSSANTFYSFIKDNIAAKTQSRPQDVDTQTVFDLIANSVVIICVDSSRARRDILNTFIQAGRYGTNTFFIDAGNEDSFGQVSFFTPKVIVNGNAYANQKASYNIPKMIPFQIAQEFIPMDLNYYRNLVDTESTASCADLNQTLAINALMATNIMGVVQNLFYRKPFTYNCLRTSLDGGNSTEYNTLHNYHQKALEGDLDYSEVKEKDGSYTSMNFLNVLGRVTMPDVAYLIKQEFDRIEAMRVAAERELARAKLLKEREERLIKEREKARENFEASLRATREAAQRILGTENPSQNEALSVVLEAVSNVEATSSEVPPLTIVRQPTPRARQVIELELPA